MKWIALVALLVLAGCAWLFAPTVWSAISSVPDCGEKDVVLGVTELFEGNLSELEADDGYGGLVEANAQRKGETKLTFPVETGFRWRSPKRFCRALLQIKGEDAGALFYAVSWQRKKLGVTYLELMGSENGGMCR
jgi:hypothetical protein